MADFDTLLKSLHNDGQGKDTDMIISSVSANLIVDTRRQFSPANGFDTIIGYEGDINSQIIVIELPKTHAGHQLWHCGHQELKWKNLSNGAEGTSTLILKNNEPKDDEPTLYEWQVPADIMAAAGNIEIYISFYDTVGTEPSTQIAFAWNTASYSGLSIGKTMSSVGSHYPARDEILLIDNETRQIIAPAGYNNIVCNCGDVGVASVYFLINRYLGKKRELDVSNATIDIYVRTSEATVTFKENITKRLYTEEISDHNQEGLVLIEWEIPKEISDSWSLTAGFEIALCFSENEKAWNSNSYTQLKVGDSIYGGKIGELAGDSNIVYQFMEQYFKDYNIVFSANDEDDE